MEIVLIRHGQPDWGSGVDIYTENPGLTDLGKLQSEKSSSVFEKNEIDELWISPLKRAQETFTPFEDKKIAKSTYTYEWLQEMHDEEEQALYGKSKEEVMAFFAKRNSQSFEDWAEASHGKHMEVFSKNIVSNLEVELGNRGVVSLDAEYDRRFDLSKTIVDRLMIISHAGTMSVLLSYFLNMPLYPWTWRKFLPRHAGHTFLRSTEISSGHFFRMKEFNNVSFMGNDKLKTY
jgi:broad specificity phosphatase PhoE